MRIASFADVQHAHRLNRWIGRPAVDEVSVDLDLEQPERLALESRLETLFNDCGCLWGAPAFLLGFLAFAWPRFARTGFEWSTAAAAFAVAVVAAVAAKLLALYASHLRLRTELDRLGRHLRGSS